MQGISDILCAGNAPVDVSPETTLHALGIDSLGLVEIFVFIEKNFNLKLLDTNLRREDLESIKSLASFVCERI